MPFWVVLAAYTSSGLAGLIYEVSWSRMLTLVMGHGMAASSTVLAAFMGGLAVGAAAGGRVASRLTPALALKVYAALELAVAVLALALPFELDVVSPLFAATYQDGHGGVMFGFVRFAVCLALLLLPAMVLGATFPTAIRWASGQSDRPEHEAGRLYAANTIGAAVGAVLASFVLLPLLGVFATSLVGALASLIALALALSVAVRGSELPDRGSESPRELADRPPGRVKSPAPKARGARKPSKHPPAVVSQPALAALVLAMTGAVTLACELVWTRVFALVVGPSTYAFGATVAAFIGGLAAGAAAGSALSGLTRRVTVLVGAALGVAAVAAAWATVQVGGDLPRRVMLDFANGQPGGLLISHALLLAATIVPTAIGIGAAFPLALDLAGGAAAPARRLGALYAVNTVAAVSGSLLTGFLAIPVLGLERTLQLAIGLLVAASGIALWRATDSSWPSRGLAACPAVLALVLLAAGGPWDRDLLASGSYKYASAVPAGVDVETALKAGNLLYTVMARPGRCRSSG